jgi:hypothetical protein
LAIKIAPSKQDTPANSHGTIREYEKSFLTLILLLGVGMLLEFITQGNGIHLPKLPYSAYLCLGFVLFILVIYLNYKKTAPIRWLSGTPAAISAMYGYTLCLLCINLIPQKPEISGILHNLGLTYIKSSFAFLFVHAYLLTILGFAILSRLTPFKWKNIAFCLSHTGLWLIITSTGLGSGDLQRVTINLLENGKESDIGISESDEMVKLPFTVKLLDFTIDEYKPTIGIIHQQTGKQLTAINKPYTEVQQGGKFNYNQWYFYITKYIPNAIFTDSIFQSSDLPGSYPAAFIEIIDIKQKKRTCGWISSGNVYLEPHRFELEPSRSIQLLQPKIKHFYSKLAISDSTHTDTLTVNLNKPLPVNGWHIYQSGYDSAKGKWSTLSVLVAVHDPWIKLIYAAITLLIVGTLFMIWTDKNRLK